MCVNFIRRIGRSCPAYGKPESICNHEGGGMSDYCRGYLTGVLVTIIVLTLLLSLVGKP